LKVHRESRAAQVYVLAIGKDGSKLESSVPNSNRRPGCSRVIADTGVAADCYNVTTAQLAQQLQTLAPGYFRDGPIVDSTGLTGTFDLHLEWMMQQQLEAGLNGPTMFSAVEKLGLHLEKKREAADMLIVDNCEQTPAEN